MTIHTAAAKGKQFAKRLVPAKVIQSRLHKRVYMQFADKTGLVYFGYVDQRNDEHSLVRGLTVSAHHRDNHYCIGSFEDYDITLVERNDTIHFPGKPARAHNWIIMSFDLHQPVDLPHVFLGLHTHDETFYAQLFTKFSHFSRLPATMLAGYDHAFVQRYAIYANPSQLVSAQRLFHPALAKLVAEHFGGLTVEISEGSLYLYAENHRPSLALLEKMIKYGVWLAKTIDVQEK